MKKILVLMLVLVVFSLVGCGKEGPMGPTGATGASGPVGTTHQYTYSAVVTPAVAFGGQAVACAAIVTDVSAGNVSTVVVYADHTGDSNLVELPGQIWDAATTQNVGLTYAISAGKVVVSWSISSPTMAVPSAFNVYVTVTNK